MNLDAYFRGLPGVDEGRADAEADIFAGKLGWRMSGKLATWWNDVAQLLQEQYQIRTEIVGACVVEEEVAARERGYNECMSAEFMNRLGRDVVSDAWRKVERTLKKRR